jgi:hypothetical protein
MTQLAVKQVLERGRGMLQPISFRFARGSTNRRRKPLSFDDDEGRLEHADAESRHGIRDEGIRNTVAPGALVTSLHKDDPADAPIRSPMRKFVQVDDIVGAVLYFAQPDQVTGEVARRQWSSRGPLVATRDKILPPQSRTQSDDGVRRNYFVITPQAIRSPELPEGSVL